MLDRLDPTLDEGVLIGCPMGNRQDAGACVFENLIKVVDEHVIAVPHDEKSSAILQGRYLANDQRVQIVRPSEVMEDLLGTVFTVGRYVTAAVLVVGITTLATMALVFLLSLQLRRRELETMIKIGGSPLRIASIVGAEVVGVLGLGAILASLLAIATSWFAADATRLLIQIT